MRPSRSSPHDLDSKSITLAHPIFESVEKFTGIASEMELLYVTPDIVTGSFPVTVVDGISGLKRLASLIPDIPL